VSALAEGPPGAAEGRGPVAALVARHRGLVALSARESHRVLKLWTQTVVAPILSSFLFILVFGLSLGTRIKQIDGVDYQQLGVGLPGAL
jgi:ABC-2 type transport system permease protein